MNRLIISTEAKQDLQDIGDYIAYNNSNAAVSFVAKLEQCCLKIAEHPGTGRHRDELQPGLKSLTEGRYLILFRHRSAASIVEIVRIVHGYRKIEKIFKIT